MQRPKVIFLDAVGTLFGVKAVWARSIEMAQRFGVQVSDSTLDQAFLRSFPAAPPIFPGTPADEIPECEFEWWNIVALHISTSRRPRPILRLFCFFYRTLYSLRHWRTLVCLSDVPALEHWQQLGIELGAVKFDSRLYWY